MSEIWTDKMYYYSTVAISIYWLLIYFYFGFYGTLFYKSRLKEIIKTAIATLSGLIVILFLAFIDDNYNKQGLALVFVLYFALQFGTIILIRLFILTINKHLYQQGKRHYHTIFIIDTKNKENYDGNSLCEYQEFGFKNIGYLSNDTTGDCNLKYLGVISELGNIIKRYSVDQVIINSTEKNFVHEMVNDLAPYNVIVKTPADIYDIIYKSFRLNDIQSPIFLEAYPDQMNLSQKNIKWTLDIILATFAIIMLMPIYLILMIALKIANGGSIIYKQERIGKNMRPFFIYKFRSMVDKAENGTPMLSINDDPRITPLGKFLRKWRLDEIPQFFNVLKGDMSIIGYRAERKFFIDQIIKEAPYYYHLMKIKPGITSLGMVKFGYAENVKEMIARLKYDMIYIENMSLILDLKILLYTFIILIKGKGK